MGCCHAYFAQGDGDDAFTIDASTLTFGRGCLREVADHAQALGMTRIAVYTDRRVRALPHFSVVVDALKAARIDHAVYDEVAVEPTDISFKNAARFAREGRFDGFISVGGGSVMDTCKAANLYSSHPAEFLTYVNAPVGDGKPVPGAVKPHVACPTTAGTGSEATGIAIFDLLSMKAKTGIQSRRLKPTTALIDPNVTRTLPSTIVASTGFDAMSHALESITAISYARHAKAQRPSLRPSNQGANPWSDAIAYEALRLIGAHFVRAVKDASDDEARSEMMYAATLAGIAFGNAGCHLPHGMSYAVSGLVRDFKAPDYAQDQAFIPHGMAVIVNAPAVYRFTAAACPDRHLDGARCLGASVNGASPADAGEILAATLVRFMQAAGFPNGLAAVGFDGSDVDALVAGAWPQQRIIGNAPTRVTRADLAALYGAAMRCW
ncbi:MAG TPA: hydroxyacid-oxoacid transhydrogenase [Burkholderiales bacterium]|nr:hydroxyacid-oxoacid transhydrogenase [Burkholderiales bacterium]